VELDLSDYPAVELRNDLNARLLDTTCPFGAQQPEHQSRSTSSTCWSS
jgi:hypothetical protein